MSNLYLAFLYWFHLLGITIWVGGSLLLPLVIVPVLQGLEPPARGKFMAGWSRKFAPWAMGAILVVVVTGILQTGTIFQSYDLFWSVNVLSIKIFVALLMIANGFYIGMGLSPKAARLAPAPGAPPSAEFLKVQSQLMTLSWVQAGLSVLVLLLVGLLTAGGPGLG